MTDVHSGVNGVSLPDPLHAVVLELEVRRRTAELQTTNVDLGTGVTLIPPADDRLGASARAGDAFRASVPPRSSAAIAADRSRRRDHVAVAVSASLDGRSPRMAPSFERAAVPNHVRRSAGAYLRET
jgi:hypothetical protein